MNYIKLLSVVFLCIALLFVYSIASKVDQPQPQSIEEVLNSTTMPPSTKMYFALIHYAEKYNIPRKYAFAIAYAETGYRGPFHWDYNPAQSSHANAMGPMQIMPRTANYVMKKTISHSELKTNIPLNVEISMKLLSKLKKQYGDWKVVFGYYNTGYPSINDYAINVYNCKYKWDKVK